MKRTEFEKLAREALENLPEFFRSKMENVGIVIEDTPSKKQLKELSGERSEIILGLYQGIPLSERTHLYGMVLPDKITLFKKNIEKTCRSKAEIKKTVIQTVKHEIAHYFGISDEHLEEMGTY
ncbi:MAG: metallopeptidase family protein [Planctomycetes bacterium]|nr:metallopeptidase family protein [Planctomycetota bacterium]